MRNNSFTLQCSILLLGMLIGLALALASFPTELQATTPGPQQYQLDVAMGIGALMQSQCFNASDVCCEYAAEIANFLPEGDPTELHLQYLEESIRVLVEKGCVEPTDGCLDFTDSVVAGPVARSVSTYPLPHETE